MMTCRPGVIVVVPFPYADRLAEKKRPALVLSKQQFTDRFGIVWIAMITSAENPGWPDDVPIAESERTGLRSPSVVRPAKLATIDAARLVRIAGEVRSEELKHALQVVSMYLG